MKFFIPLVATLSLAASVLALSSDCRGVSCRYTVAQRDIVSEEYLADLVRRGKDKAVVAAAVSKIQQGQANRQKKNEAKAVLNKKTAQKASNTPDVKNAAAAYRDKAKAAGTPMKEINAKSDRLKSAAKDRAVTQAVKDAKAARTKKWEAQKNAPGPKPKPKQEKAALTQAQKHNVKQQFKSAAEKLKNTQGLPGRKDKVEVGQSSTDGRAARQGVFNTYLHSKNPVGRNPINKQPKTFKNAPYPADHQEPALRNKKALPQNGKEYPVINNSPNGFTASNGKPGPLRTVTYKKGGQRHAAVIGHDESRDPNHKDEHYVATPKKP